MRQRERVNLYIRIKGPNGRRFYAAPDLKRQRTAIINGKPKLHDEGVYYIRYEHEGRRVWESVGNDVGIALHERQMREARLVLGVPVSKPLPPPTPAPKPAAPSERRETLAEAIQRYVGIIAVIVEGLQTATIAPRHVSGIWNTTRSL